MMTSSLPVLQPRLLLGLQTHIESNAHFISDDEVVYPVGGVLCINNFSQKKQKFIKLPEKGANVTKIFVSPNRKMVGIIECGDKLSITIYDPWTCKKKKQLFLPAEKEFVAKEIVTACFTYDSKNVILITGEPDWTMFFYKVDKGKLESMTRANNSNNTGTVLQIACNPNDSTVVVLVGYMLCRYLACTEGNWRQYGFNKAENMNIKCATWISQDRVLAGTADGKILYFENADLKSTHSANDFPFLLLKVADEGQPQIIQPQQQPSLTDICSLTSEVGMEVGKIVSYSKGFLFSYTPGAIHFYEKESQNKYKRRCVFRIQDRSVERTEEERIDESEDYGDDIFNLVNVISVNPNEDRFLATCNETQIYTSRLWVADGVSEINMAELGLPLHHGNIAGAAVCLWKPIFMTTGTWDRTVRIWNYENETLEVMKRYTEDVYGCDLHPNGLFAIVGFSDKVRFMKILIDDLVVTREYPIRACKLCKFSNFGHLFAAVNGNIIPVYSSITFEHLFNLKGHNGLVTGLSWVHDDLKLASCGTEGAVYEWQISTTRRICETIVKVCHFTDVALTQDGKSNYSVGSDGRCREIVNSNVYGDIIISNHGLDALSLSNSDYMLFVTGNNGVVYSVQLPFIDAAVFNEYTVHSSRCTSLKITKDDKYLISTSRGCICIWKISNAEGRQIKFDKEFKISTEVMIERLDLLDKINLIRDLQVRMNELQTEHSYQLKQSETAHKATVKEIHQGYSSAIEELKEKNEILEQEHNQEISNINVEINKMKSQHDVFVQKLESSYNEKLIVEYDKYMTLEEKLNRMRDRYDKELEDLTEAKRVSEETITRRYEQELLDRQTREDELHDKIEEMRKEHEEIKSQIEDDADREIYELKQQFEKELREEQDLNVKLRGETQASKKKLQASQKNIDDLNYSVHLHEIEQHKLKNVIYGLEGTISDLQKEISERDSTIQDKEKRISELKQKNQELEKFKFILDFKIDELKAQIEPRDRTIREQTEQINDMVRELENFQKMILSLELQVLELKEKLKASNNEVKREIVKNRAAKASLKEIKTEIHNASGLVQEVPKLQRAVRGMYHKYNADRDFAIAHAEDTEAKMEFLRQRDFLERTVKVLKKQVGKSQTSEKEHLNYIQENSQLIAETNYLRGHLKQEKRENNRMGAILGINKSKNFAGGRKKLEQALATKEEIRNEFRDKIEENERSIQLLQEENLRLHDRLSKSKELK